MRGCPMPSPAPFFVWRSIAAQGRDSIPFAPFISLLCVMESRVEPGRVLVKLGSADCLSAAHKWRSMQGPKFQERLLQVRAPHHPAGPVDGWRCCWSLETTRAAHDKAPSIDRCGWVTAGDDPSIHHDSVIELAPGRGQMRRGEKCACTRAAMVGLDRHHPSACPDALLLTCWIAPTAIIYLFCS